MPFQAAVPLAIGGSVNPAIVLSPGAAPTSIIESGLPFTVQVGFQVTGAGVLVLGGNFNVSVAFEGFGTATEANFAAPPVPVASGVLNLAVPSRTYTVNVAVPGTLAVGAYRMIALIIHNNAGIPGPIAGFSDDQIIQIFPNSPATIP